MIICSFPSCGVWRLYISSMWACSLWYNPMPPNTTSINSNVNNFNKILHKSSIPISPCINLMQFFKIDTHFLSTHPCIFSVIIILHYPPNNWNLFLMKWIFWKWSCWDLIINIRLGPFLLGVASFALILMVYTHAITEMLCHRLYRCIC